MTVETPLELWQTLTATELIRAAAEGRIPPVPAQRADRAAGRGRAAGTGHAALGAHAGVTPDLAFGGRAPRDRDPVT